MPVLPIAHVGEWNAWNQGKYSDCCASRHGTLWSNSRSAGKIHSCLYSQELPQPDSAHLAVGPRLVRRCLQTECRGSQQLPQYQPLAVLGEPPGKFQGGYFEINPQNAGR
eukprot:Lithocolla_globosa_v1_NODE_1035_length_2929_cov_10.346555.p3 type:complete len:110 gc:universal NODE_1035_length_2929_cov_10.346555:1349-1678(+)